MQGLAFNRPSTRQAWRGPSLLLVDNAGVADGAGLSGYFFRETRFLSLLRLRVQGEAPVPCSAAEVGPADLEFSLIYPPVGSRRGGGSGSGGDRRWHGILSRGLDLDLRYTVHPASLEVRLVVTARWDDEVDLCLGWELAADFAPLLSTMDGESGPPAEAEPLDDGVRFRCADPRLPLETRITGTGGSWAYRAGLLSTRLPLVRQAPAEVVLRIDAVDREDPIPPDAAAAREARQTSYLAALPRLHATGDAPIVEITSRAMADLGSAALLEGPDDEWLMPAAGYPLYPAAFGRDAATVSWQAGAFDHGRMAWASAAKLCRLQGTRRDDARDELPGRIIQQQRRDPLSRLGVVPFGRYYGDVASPFMYVITVANAYAWSGDRSLLERHYPAMLDVLEWARTEGDMDGDGYVEYLTRSEHGPVHQGWKDSDNAVVDEDGQRVAPPFASCEIQGYHFAALQLMAGLAAVTGERATAVRLWRRARRLKTRFNRDFWLEDEGCIAFGLGPDKRPVRVATSNAGQCIATGIVSDHHLPRLVERLFQPDLFSGWGIRTLSSENPAYNPLSYHLGSVWPVENASILFGLRRYGFDARAVELARALYDLAKLWPAGRTPECVGGYARDGRGHPGAYPRANPVQSWNQSVFPLLLQSLLGAQALAPLHLLALDPVLPDWLPDLTIRGWRIGDAVLSIRFWRDGNGASRFEVLERSGTVHVMRQPPIDALDVGVGDRLRALVRGLRRR